MNLESDIRKFIIKEKKKTKNFFSTFHVLLYLSIAASFFSIYWGVAGMIVSVIGIEVSQFITYRRHPMTEKWIEMVNSCPRISKRGLLFLSMSIDKKGFISLKNADEFIDIEVDERLALRAEGKPLTILSDEENRLFLEYKEVRSIKRRSSWYGKLIRKTKDNFDFAFESVSKNFKTSANKKD